MTQPLSDHEIEAIRQNLDRNETPNFVLIDRLLATVDEYATSCHFTKGLDGWRQCVAHRWEGFVDEIKRVRLCPSQTGRMRDWK